MKANKWILIGVIACLLIAAETYFWATGMMNSLYSFRSPLHDAPPAPGQALGNPLTRRLVYVIVDALRDDTSHKAEVMPFLNELRTQAAWATVHSRTPSYSDPSWTALMTGAWPDLNDGPAMNVPYEDTPTWTQDNLFRAAHRYGLKTAVSGFDWWQKLIPQTDVDASFYTKGEDQDADRQVLDAALPWLKSGKVALVLIHLDQVDYAGHHECGVRDPRWDAAAKRSDDLLREIASNLDLKRDTLLIISDHGQIDRGGHGGQESVNLVEPLVLAGAGVRPGEYPDIQQVDIAPTAAALLGTNIPASAQGFVQTAMLALSADQEASITAVLLVQKTTLASAYLKAIGHPAKIQPAPDSAYALIQSMDNARLERLRRERLPRFAFAILLAVLPAILLIRKRGKTIGWLAAAALLYLALFHGRYALLEGRSYSLSSIRSPEDIILFTAVTAGVALIIAWLGTAFILHIFRMAPRQSAEITLGLVFFILYLLAIPILWSFALNGARVTWTLPDLASMYLGFLSILQCMVVAAVGLILTGAAAVICLAGREQRKRDQVIRD
jgi:hypothetical protein